MKTEASTLIFGAGTLGAHVIQLIREGSPESPVIAVTQTTKRHDQLKVLRAIPLTASEFELKEDVYDNVVIAIPPSQNQGEFQNAVRIASARVKTKGTLIFISSTGVYSENDGGWVHEASATLDNSVLMAAESIVRAKGGSILRLAGLYERDRGPHRVYLRGPEVNVAPNDWLNLIHYIDAARLVLSIFKSNLQGQMFLGSDATPVTKETFVRICEQSIDPNPHFAPRKFAKESANQHGKRCRPNETFNKLNFSLKWSSFSVWAKSHHQPQE